jgi:hypothetical protein
VNGADGEMVGTPAVGPFQLDRLIAPMEDTEEVIHMDRQLTAVYDVLHRRYSLEAHKEVDSPGVMALIVLNWSVPPSSSCVVRY